MYYHVLIYFTVYIKIDRYVFTVPTPKYKQTIEYKQKSLGLTQNIFFIFPLYGDKV